LQGLRLRAAFGSRRGSGFVCGLRGIGLTELSAATERNVDGLLAFSSAV